MVRHTVFPFKVEWTDETRPMAVGLLAEFNQGLGLYPGLAISIFTAISSRRNHLFWDGDKRWSSYGTHILGVEGEAKISEQALVAMVLVVARGRS